MFRLSYHGKLRLKRLGIALGILLLIALVALGCWFVWMQRYIVYTRDGVVFDYERSTLELEDKPHNGDAQRETVSLNILIDDGEDDEENQTQNTGILSGVYVDTALLLKGVDRAKEALGELTPGSAVMVDVKSKFGNFYYTTAINGASQSDSISAPEMDAFIEELRKGDCYLIARLPAFRDSAFALQNQPCGLPLASGVLWTDEEKCYWLNPTKDAVLSNLVQICRELRELGFDEVVFSDFSIPDSGRIVYSSDIPKDEALKRAADYLVAACGGEYFAISFVGTTDFPLPAGNTRLYVEGVAPEQLEMVYEKAPGMEPLSQTVFVVDTRDTRYDTYSHIRLLK